MNPDQAYKNKALERVAVKIADSLENGQLNKEQAAEISSYVLENIDNKKNNSELFNFLEELAVKWSIFSSLVTSQQDEVAESVKQEKVEEIGDLIKDNKIDEALKVAADANNANDINTGGES